ncbi:MAG: hypothetical protein JW808_11180 [Victivallales bacterium]|nr:hypothetical protein [Victivallales bacterium]
MRRPDFENLQAVLENKRPKRPTLFEFFMNESLYEHVTGIKLPADADQMEMTIRRIKAFEKLGYDYATVHCSFAFPGKEHARESTISLNDGVLIRDRKDFEACPWPDVDAHDYSMLDKVAPHIPDGMKLIICGPGGVLENVIGLTGYDNLCFMSIDDPGLLSDICDAVGSRLLRHYEISSAFDTIGAAISNDDWGFKTQTMLSPEDMRKYIIPWHRRIVKAIHDCGKPAILHSCGNLENVMDDIIDDINFQGKHSYEDSICPVEEAYARWGSRIAILGGIDLDFLCRATPSVIAERAKGMLELSSNTGGYALGSGNSIPEYIPRDNYLAMVYAATG